MLGPRTQASAKSVQLARFLRRGLPYPSTSAPRAVQESSPTPLERTKKARALTAAGVPGPLQGPQPAQTVGPGTGPAHRLHQVQPSASLVTQGPTPSSQWHPLIQPAQSVQLEPHRMCLLLEVGPRARRALLDNTRPLRELRLAPPAPREPPHRFEKKVTMKMN